MIRLFCGHDSREAIGFHVFVASVIERASVPVAIHVLGSEGLPQGSNAFTYSRFLVPSLCGFKGRAIFADASDMLMLGDVAELDALFDESKAVQVVQHPTYTTRHPIKYRGTDMQCPNLSYARKNWASLMLINCKHPGWEEPAHRQPSVGLLGFDFLPDDAIGALPSEWNRLVDEGQPPESAKIMHWTAGIPAFPLYANAPGADAWREQRDKMLGVV